MAAIVPYHDNDFIVVVLYNGKGFQLFALFQSVEFQLSNGDKLFTPKGFRFDGRSSPGALKGLFPTFGKGAKAWLLHDLLYVMKYGVKEFGWSMEQARKFADDEMYRLLKELNPDEPKRNWLSYKTVRIFGKKVHEQTREVMDDIHKHIPPR